MSHRVSLTMKNPSFSMPPNKTLVLIFLLGKTRSQCSGMNATS
jgi:hypothetical protein